MKHGGYIKEFYWQSLQHFGSILLSESHSWYPLSSLSPYLAIKPYKPEMYILHWMEIFSILGVFVSLVHNMFRGFLYVYDISDEDPIKFVRQGLATFDLVFFPICVLIYFFIIAPMYNKVKYKIMSFCITIRREWRKEMPNCTKNGVLHHRNSSVNVTKSAVFYDRFNGKLHILSSVSWILIIFLLLEKKSDFRKNSSLNSLLKWKFAVLLWISCATESAWYNSRKFTILRERAF